MSKVFIIHGAYGDGNENWIPWLKGNLEKLGFEVVVPKFPTPEDQTLENWFKVFDLYSKKVDSKTIFVGHSLGCPFILNLFEKYDFKTKSCFLVAGFAELLDQPIDKINKTFVDRDFDWEKIKDSCKNFYLFNSDDDPYVPLEKGKELAKKLSGELVVVKGAGHFNEKAGFLRFDELLEKIRDE